MQVQLEAIDFSLAGSLLEEKLLHLTERNMGSCGSCAHGIQLLLVHGWVRDAAGCGKTSVGETKRTRHGERRRHSVGGKDGAASREARSRKMLIIHLSVSFPRLM